MRFPLKKNLDLALAVTVLATGLFFSIKQAPPHACEAAPLVMAAEEGDLPSQTALAQCYFFSVSVPQDREKFLKWANRAAERGYPQAEFLMARYYTTIVHDNAEAKRWSLRSAEHGDRRSQRFIGYLYSTGDLDTEIDYKEAVAWWLLAAEQGDRGAQRNLGLAYAAGQGVRRNDIVAGMWFALAAEKMPSRATYYHNKIPLTISDALAASAAADKTK